MNRIFSRVWNASLQQWVVASEFATSHSPIRVGSRHRALTLAPLALALISSAAFAQEFTVTDGTTSATITDGGTVRFEGDQNVRVTQTGADNDAVIEVALAPDLVADSLTTGATRVDTTGVAIGSDVRLGSTGLSLGSGAPGITTAGIQAGGLAISGVANGTAADHAVNFSQLQAVQTQATAGWNVAVGANTYNIAPNGRVTFTGDSNISVALTGAADAASVAYSLNPNLNATSVTTGATVLSGTGVQVGSAVALTNTGLAIAGGPSVTATGINAGGQRVTGLANGAINASSTDAVSGSQIFDLFIEEGAGGVRYFRARSTEADSQALGDESVAIGPRTIAAGTSSFAAGDGASTSETAEAAIAIGQGARTGTALAGVPDGEGSIAIGRSTVAAGNRTIALGDAAAVLSEVATDSLAIGTGARINGASSGATAVGLQAAASASQATALGAFASASGASSVAIGQATATGGSAFAGGTGAFAGTTRGVAIGSGAGVGTVENNAGDRTDHIAVGTSAGQTVVGNRSTAIGYRAGQGVEGDDNLALGSEAGRALVGNNNISIGVRANDGAGARAQSISIGDNSRAGTNSVALGSGAVATGNETLALGKDAVAGANGVAVGALATAEGSNIALGRNSAARLADGVGSGYLTGEAAPGSVVSVGSSTGGGVFQRRIVNVADGSQGYDAVNVRQLQRAQNSVTSLIGGGVQFDPATGTYGTITIDGNSYSNVADAIRGAVNGTITEGALPPNVVRYEGAGNSGRIANVAAGVNATDAVNVQQLEEQIAENGVKYFSANTTIAANRNNDGATGENALAIGPEAVAGGDSSLAVGHSAVVDSGATGAVAIGFDVNAKAVNSTVIGNSDSAAYGAGGIAIGQAAVSQGLNSIVMGTGAEADFKSGSTVNNAIVIGTVAEVTADNGIAMGHDALASEVNAVAQGFNAEATGTSAMAHGTRSRATATNAQASGTDAQASGANAIATGTNSRSLAGSGVAIGTNTVSGYAPPPGDAGQNVNTIAIGTGAQAVYQDAMAIGRAATASDLAAAAVGDGANASNEAALALGRSASASGESSIAQGDGAVASAEAAQASGRGAAASGVSALAQGDGANAAGANASAVGRASQASGASSVALGDDARATDTNATALGVFSRATALNATALGSGAQAGASGALALGQGSQALHAGSVALGQGAITAAAQGTSNQVVDGQTYTFAGQNPVATASVGSAGQERTITNVAAGRVNATSTDAINGSQLHGTNQAVTALGNNLDTAGASFARALSPTSSYDPTTHQVTPRIVVRGNTYGDVQTAVGYAAQGWNASANGGASTNVAPGQTVDFRNSDGNIVIGRDTRNFQFDLADDVTVDSLTAGGTVVSDAGLAIAGGPSVLQTGINAGGLAINGVAAGEISSTSQQAVNGSQVFGVSNSVRNTLGGNAVVGPDGTITMTNIGGTGANTVHDAIASLNTVSSAGWNATDTDGHVANIGPNGTVTFTGDANVSVAQTGLDDNGEIAIALNRDLNLDSVTAGNSRLDIDGLAVADAAGNATAIGAGTISVGNPDGSTSIGGTSIAVGGDFPILIDGNAGTIGGLQNRTFDPTNFVSGQAATEDQLAIVSGAANAGWNVRANDEAVGENVGPGGSVNLRNSDGNVVITRDDTDVSFDLADDIEVESLVAGNSRVDTNGLTVTGASGSTANYGATGALVQDASGNSTSVGAGTLSVVNGADTTTIGGNAISVGGSAPIAINGNTGIISGLQNQTVGGAGFADGSGRAATEEQLALVNQTANAGWNVRANDESTGANVGPGGNVNLRNDDGNVLVSRSGTDVSFDLADDIQVESLTAGNTVIDTTGVAIGADVMLGDTGLTIIGGPSVTLAGIDAGGQVISNVATGVAATDAVNVAQLEGAVETNRTKYYSVNSTGGSNFNNEGATGTDAMAAGKDAEAEGEEAVALGLGSAANGDGAIALGARAQAISLNSLAIGSGAVSSHANSIALGAGSVTTVGAQTNYQGAFVGSSSSAGELNVGGRQITGVAAGSAAMDAVNVSQLQGGVASAVSQANDYTDTQIGNVNNRIDVLDGRVGAIEGDIVDIRGDITDIQGDIVAIQGDITDLDDRVSVVEGAVVQVDGRLNALESGASGPFQISQGETYVAPVPTGQNASAGGNGAVASGNNSVALGNQSTASGAGSTALGQGATASAANSTAIGQGSTARHANSVALGAGSATTVGAQANYNAAYVGTSTSTGEVNVGGRTISGVAPGMAGTDAVNVNQLGAGVSQAITTANRYTDGRIEQIQDDMWTIDRGYRGATASAMAMAGLPQAYLPGKSMLSVAFGGYQSEYGMAVGLSGITDNGRWVYKAQASGNTTQEWGFSVGAGIQW